MPGSPQAGAILWLFGPFKWPAIKFVHDGTEAFRLFGNSDLCPVEFDEQHRLLGHGELGVRIAHAHLHRVEKLDASHRYARLNSRDGGITAGLDRRKTAHPRRCRLRNTVQFQRQLSDDAEGPFRADDEASEIVSRRGFAGAT